MKKFLLISVVAILLLTSCATVMTEGESTITVQSNVENATVKVDGFSRGKTPATFILSNDKSYMVEVEKEGYVPQYFQIKRSVKLGWQVVDLLVTGFIGNVIDLVSPNGYELSPTEIYVELKEK